MSLKIVVSQDTTALCSTSLQKHLVCDLLNANDVYNSYFKVLPSLHLPARIGTAVNKQAMHTSVQERVP